MKSTLNGCHIKMQCNQVCASAAINLKNFSICNYLKICCIPWLGKIHMLHEMQCEFKWLKVECFSQRQSRVLCTRLTYNLSASTFRYEDEKKPLMNERLM